MAEWKAEEKAANAANALVKKEEAEAQKAAKAAKAAFVAEERAKAAAIRAVEQKEKADLKALQIVARAEAKPEAQAETRPKVEVIQNKIKIIKVPASSSSSSTQRNHGIELIENKSKSFWNKQNISVIKAQAELRGYRFSDLETKGGGAKSKFKKFKKKDYLDVLFKILKNYIIIIIVLRIILIKQLY